jgi:hypothetical protein
MSMSSVEQWRLIAELRIRRAGRDENVRAQREE